MSQLQSCVSLSQFFWFCFLFNDFFSALLCAFNFNVKASGNEPSTKKNSVLCADCDGNGKFPEYNAKGF